MTWAIMLDFTFVKQPLTPRNAPAARSILHSYTPKPDDYRLLRCFGAAMHSLVRMFPVRGTGISGVLVSAFG